MQKTRSQIYDQHQRMFQRAMRIGERNARRAHPETGGNELLVHNWGNEAANKAWRDAWARWRKVDAPYERLYDEAEHRDHAGRFRPIWCKYCQGE